ncbi:MAG: SprT-like domain-containing protein [Lentimicrobiaceae bacterium]|jgi:hypothetical protein|nr:SprT-like domain-containing protein [Lentimicrobiaceae bacterium]
MSPDEKQILAKYFPEAAVEIVAEWLTKEDVFLQFTRTRRTKLGDFRVAQNKNDRPRISLNHDMHPYQMLITFVHELAHKLTFDRYGRRVNPHGEEWKNTYRQLMQPFLIPEIFPADIIVVLHKSIRKAQATSSADNELIRLIRAYDNNENQKNRLTVEEIPYNSIFQLENGKTFCKYEKVRKRFRCQCLQNKRWYLVNPMAYATLIEKEK